MLNITNAINKGVIVIINERKNIEKRDISIKNGDIIGKRDNKKGGKPFINCNN